MVRMHSITGPAAIWSVFGSMISRLQAIKHVATKTKITWLYNDLNALLAGLGRYDLGKIKRKFDSSGVVKWGARKVGLICVHLDRCRQR